MAAGVEVLTVTGVLDIIGIFVVLLLFGVLRNKPGNRPIYFSKLDHGRAQRPIYSLKKLKTYWIWIPETLRMNERELVEHAGLDSVVYLRIYKLGLKIFSPIMLLSLLVLIPVNASGGRSPDISGIDKLSILNVSPGSNRFIIHIAMAYLFTFWTCLMLYKEYSNVAFKRLHFLANQRRAADQFTVIVRNIPVVPCHSILETVDAFFRRNHGDKYLGQQAVYNVNRYAKLVKKKESLLNWLEYYEVKFAMSPNNRPTGKVRFFGLCGGKVDLIDYYRARIIELDTRIASERQRVLNDPESILPVVFVQFESRCSAAACAQTQQSKDPTQWVTEWAPEPRDVCWENLAIPFISQNIRKFLILLALLFLIFFYMLPITLVHFLFDLDVIVKVAPSVRPIKDIKVVKSFIEGFLPNLLLFFFLRLLQKLLMVMSKAEGNLSLSSIERTAASKYYYFLINNVFFGSLAAGVAIDYSFSQGPSVQILRNIGLAVTAKSTFFITYMMLDGWAGVAFELLRLKSLAIYHLKSKVFITTERDRQRAMDGSISLWKKLPSLHLFFLIGIIYAVVAPIVLPFITLFFTLAFVVYRNQIMNVYSQKHESAAAFWPQVHSRIISSLVMSHVVLIGLLGSASPSYYTPLLIIFLPVTTIWFNRFCKCRFEPVFRNFPLEEATEMDSLEPAVDLRRSYLHPVFHALEQEDLEEAV